MGAARLTWIDEYMGVYGNMGYGWRDVGLPKYREGDPEPDALTADEKHQWWTEQARQHLAAYVAAHGGDQRAWGQAHPDGYSAFLEVCPEPPES
jgi:hypothetical protein